MTTLKITPEALWARQQIGPPDVNYDLWNERRASLQAFSQMSQSVAFVQGIVVTCAHMAKGLEFDEVIIPQADDENYHSEIDRSLLYVAVTRAMHRLTLTCSGRKFLFTKPVDKLADFYRRNLK